MNFYEALKLVEFENLLSSILDKLVPAEQAIELNAVLTKFLDQQLKSIIDMARAQEASRAVVKQYQLHSAAMHAIVDMYLTVLESGKKQLPSQHIADFEKACNSALEKACTKLSDGYEKLTTE